MDIRDYAERAKDKVQERLGSGYTVTVAETVKNNGIRKTGLCIRRAGEDTGAIIYLESTGLTVDVDGILAAYLAAPKCPVDGGTPLCFEDAKDKICWSCSTLPSFITCHWGWMKEWHP